MSEVANIYDNGPLSPIARIKDNLSIYTAKKWSHYQVSYLEPWPRSSPLRVEMVALAGATTIAANGTIAKRLLAILQVADGEMLHVRFEPLDDVEGVVWEQSGTGKFNSRNTHARVDMASCQRDPYLAGSTFFILGYQRDMNLEVRNPHPVALNQARFQFMGYRYVLDTITPNLDSLPDQGAKDAVIKKLSDGDKETVAQYIGPTTWLPAEGR
ncbi:MAG: hypothetical protein PHZ19_11860 [Candidatus Thermoplasmatota archaeon]|nr:hypothetical protein [Candidatus Thermoplasmatota archaeon]